MSDTYLLPVEETRCKLAVFNLLGRFNFRLDGYCGGGRLSGENKWL